MRVIDDDPFAKMFELTARLREQSLESIQVAEDALEWSRGQLRWLAESPGLTDEQTAQAERMAAELTETVWARLDGLAKQSEGYTAMLGSIDLERPEHFGMLLSEAESLRSVAAMTVALAADIRLIQEIRRRVNAR